jgi:tetratricopeptide (TPR) repeat protein
MKGDYKNALEDYDESLRLDPRSKLTLLRRSVIRASCWDARYRDGAKAVSDAIAAMKLSSQMDAFALATLAAAHAENGHFDNAIEYQKQALKLSGTEEYRKRLKLFEDGWPYHEPNPKP